MKFPRRSGLATLTLLVLGSWMAWAQGPPGGRGAPSATAPPPMTPIAKVGGRIVAKEEFEARATEAMREYRARLGQDVPDAVKPVVRRQILESLLRRELLVLEAAKRGIQGTDAEAEAQLKKEPFFNPDGKFDPARWNAIRTTQPESYARAIVQIKSQLGAKKLADQLERDAGGSAASIRTAAERSMGTASYDVLALKRVEMRGDAREPREREVIDAYRRSADQWRKPAEARLTLLVVDQPGISPADESDPARAAAWRTRMRARADSAIARARADARLEDLAKEYGSLHRDVTVTADNFPGYWRGDARDAAAVFATRPGGIVSTPIAGNHGWLVARVDEQKPPRVAPLAEVAREVRGTLRTEARLHGDDRDLRALYDQKRPSLRVTAWKLRYAVFDTAAQMPDPPPAELDRWYRAHQADFSSFDPQAGTIRVRPLAEVRDVATTRWKSERRREAARFGAQALAESWQRGARDRNAEKAALIVRDAGPWIPGAVVDTGLAARTLADTLGRRPAGRRAAAIPFASGWVAYHLYEEIPNYVPTFEQMRVELAQERSVTRMSEEEVGAKALFEKDPSRFAARNVIQYSRLPIPTPDPMGVPLTRAAVEKYYRDHLDRYSAAEQVRVRHILVAADPGDAESVEKARVKAQGLLERARGGEDFAELARKYSDDVATRDKGGDLGDFGRGAMLPAFEDAAFRLQPGEISGLVRTEAGFHILRCVSHLPLYTQALAYVYPNVGWDAASELADSIARRRCDSLSATLRTAAQGRAAAARLKLPTDHTFHEIGDRRAMPELVSFYIRLERTKPGQMVPGSGYDRTFGHFVAWVDSISSAQERSWEQARNTALEEYRRGGSQRALDAKRAELDSLMAAGWSADSIAALWGGWEKVENAAPGTGLPGLGGSEAVDSLVFGTPRRPAALAEGQTSGWIDVPGGLARVRLRRRAAPDASRVAATVEGERRVQVEQKLQTFFDDLKKRYPIQILDERLRDTPLPPPPQSRLR